MKSIIAETVKYADMVYLTDVSQVWTLELQKKHRLNGTLQIVFKDDKGE